VREHFTRWGTDADREMRYEKSSSRDPDWLIVFLFYSALHLTQAYLATKSLRFTAEDHGSRWTAIRSSPELGPRFRDAYKALKSLSESVRYSPWFVARAQDLTDAKRHHDLVSQFLRSRVERWLSGHPSP